MTTSLVLTVIGPDRPGLVETISSTITDHEGNWLDSRMSRLGGQFAGILHVSVPDARADALTHALEQLDSEILRVQVEQESAQVSEAEGPPVDLALVGTDTPGIIRDISRALAELQVNVEELKTERVSAPMSGELMFRAEAQLRLPAELSFDELQERLERVANDLVVDLRLG